MVENRKLIKPTPPPPNCERIDAAAIPDIAETA
jgi:hypothetical protein